jgi:hypothetical protein
MRRGELKEAEELKEVEEPNHRLVVKRTSVFFLNFLYLLNLLNFVY